MKSSKVQDYLSKPIAECTDLEVYNAALQMVKGYVGKKGYNEGKKKIYYISAEFLIGKLLSNNLINLGLYEQVRDELAAAGKSLAHLEEMEAEPSLGNGGLGRLAACFLDSFATLGIPGDGIGIAYHCGLFKQVFAERKQKEQPNYWLTWGKESWLRRTEKQFTIPFGGFEVKSTMYEIDVTGYDSKSGRLRLFDIDSVDEMILKEGIRFDKHDFTRNLTLFLYPDDSDTDGRMLRIYQEYFMCSNGAQLIIEEAKAKGSNLHDLADYAQVQINDTHPTMVIPELLRLLDQEGIELDEAIEIVRKVCGYTNHTILAEALEKWPKWALEKAVPHLMHYIYELNEWVKARFEDESVRIIDNNDYVHMAHIDIHFSHSVNGVAALHTEILKNSELHNFYELYPQKFNNKTNGITFRRWLMSCNPELANLITSRIGNGWKKDATELEKLLAFQNDREFLNELLSVKRLKKEQMAGWLQDHQGIYVNPDTIFDMQSKRLHEYKRQQLNLLWLIHEYIEIKGGRRPHFAVTSIFGAKAAPAYTIAQDIIHAIICLQDLIKDDPQVNQFLRVVMVENYNVEAAEKMIPACDLSEQISLASKEASGTGNMKYMLNGAVTLGTMDGANVEINDLVGEDNIYTFGEDSQTVINHYANNDYNPRSWYENNARIREAVDFLISDAMKSVGDRKALERLHNELISKDYFMTFPDFEDYCRMKSLALHATLDRTGWAQKLLVNIAKAGFFSSDRTIRQYNDEIWHII